MKHGILNLKGNGKISFRSQHQIVEIKFSFTSTVAGKVKVEVGGVNNAEYILIGMNTIEHEFTAALRRNLCRHAIRYA